MERPLAYFITFRCYGTWLHGDETGAVDRENNTFGSPYINPDERLHSFRVQLCWYPPVRLNSQQRQIVEESVRLTCHSREWILYSVSARTNHVHVIVASDCPPERVLLQLKAKATCALRRAGAWPDDRSPWVSGGSKRYLWREKALARAIEYVNNQDHN